ncbi:MAG: NTP transferase domain-containing protein [Pirellulales bacterium]|nr:NTP transferase domain-containing protein [Pirellulales bacterium]
MAIVLAAGQGTRMKSALPKVLIEVAGRPMIDFVLDALDSAGVGRIVVVVGFEADKVRQALESRQNVEFATQTERRGTGHAVMCCEDQLASHEGPVLIVTGDSPMMQASSLRNLLTEFRKRDAACLLGTARKQDPHGFGRIVRDADGHFERIVEEKDATDAQRAITEVNMSCYVFDSASLRSALSQLTDENQQSEYYITDCPGILLDEGKIVQALDVLQPVESMSINTPQERDAVEAELLRIKARDD